MHSDAAFYIGKSHAICQDYVTNFSARNKTQVVLCDGCSSSEMVDVGARLMALAASDLIDDSNNLITAAGNNHQLFKSVSDYVRYKYTHPLLMHHNSMFDATVLYAAVANTKLHIGIAGDGVIALKEKDGPITVITRECENMPDYPSYYMLPDRREAYLSQDIRAVTTLYNLATKTIINQFNDPAFAYCVKSYDLTEGSHTLEWVACMSDGVYSFQDSNRVTIPMLDVVEQLTAFKSFTGVFAQRRLNAFRKESAGKGWSHYDDISIGGIYLGEV